MYVQESDIFQGLLRHTLVITIGNKQPIILNFMLNLQGKGPLVPAKKVVSLYYSCLLYKWVKGKK